MNSSQIGKWIFLFSTVFLLSACVWSLQPLGEEKPLPKDSLLIGTWKLNEEGDLSYLHIGNRGSASELVSVEIGIGGTIKTETFKTIATELNKLNYLSLGITDGNRMKWVFLKYQIIEGKKLRLWSVDRQYIRDALAKGSIQGVADDKSFIPSVELDMSQSDLRDFIVKHDGEIFKEQLKIYEKIE